MNNIIRIDDNIDAIACLDLSEDSNIETYIGSQSPTEHLPSMEQKGKKRPIYFTNICDFPGKKQYPELSGKDSLKKNSGILRKAIDWAKENPIRTFFGAILIGAGTFYLYKQNVEVIERNRRKRRKKLLYHSSSQPDLKNENGGNHPKDPEPETTTTSIILGTIGGACFENLGFIASCYFLTYGLYLHENNYFYRGIGLLVGSQMKKIWNIVRQGIGLNTQQKAFNGTGKENCEAPRYIKTILGTIKSTPNTSLKAAEIMDLPYQYLSWKSFN